MPVRPHLPFYKESFASGHRASYLAVYPVTLDSLHVTSSQDVLAYPMRTAQAHGGPKAKHGS